MKPILILALSAFLLLSCKSTYIYMVRHGEKNRSEGENPHLTPEGKNRAIQLKEVLASKAIRHVFSTNYYRTLETATPTALAKSIAIEIYSADSLMAFAQKLKALQENTLVVGHSNTLLPLLDAMHIPHKITAINDSDFGNLFIVEMRGGKVKGLVEKRYGN